MPKFLFNNTTGCKVRCKKIKKKPNPQTLKHSNMERTDVLIQVDGIVLGTQISVGATPYPFTNLVRENSVTSITSTWRNDSPNTLSNLSLEVLGSNDANVSMQNGLLSTTVLGPTETLVLTADIQITGTPGELINLSSNIFRISWTNNADGSSEYSYNQHGSRNLITLQGDINYDGKVTLQDLAYLNHAHAVVQNGGDFPSAHDVNYDGVIDIGDQSSMTDFNQTIHTGYHTTSGLSCHDWSLLSQQTINGNIVTWDSSYFIIRNEDVEFPEAVSCGDP